MTHKIGCIHTLKVVGMKHVLNFILIFIAFIGNLFGVHWDKKNLENIFNPIEHQNPPYWTSSDNIRITYVYNENGMKVEAFVEVCGGLRKKVLYDNAECVLDSNGNILVNERTEERFNYDSLGNVIHYANFGLDIDYEYDSINRLLKCKSYSWVTEESTLLEYGYFSGLKPFVKVNRWFGDYKNDTRIEYFYDSKKRIESKVTFRCKNSEDYELLLDLSKRIDELEIVKKELYTYSDDGSLTWIHCIDSNGETISLDSIQYVFNNQGDLTEVKSSNKKEHYKYDPFGCPKQYLRYTFNDSSNSWLLEQEKNITVLNSGTNVFKPFQRVFLDNFVVVNGVLKISNVGGEVQVTNPKGQILVNKSINEKVNLINLKQLNGSGVYFLTLRLNNKVVSKVFCIE